MFLCSEKYLWTGLLAAELFLIKGREGSIPDSKYDSVWLLVRSLQKQKLSGTVFSQQRSSSIVKS